MPSERPYAGQLWKRDTTRVLVVAAHLNTVLRPRTALPSSADGELTRANQLDALAGVLPLERRDQLASPLTDQDIATVHHLVEQGMGENTLRALASDLAYLDAWSLARTGSPLPWPAPEDSVMRFIAHHLWDPAQCEKDPEHGMLARGRHSPSGPGSAARGGSPCALHR